MDSDAEQLVQKVTKWVKRARLETPFIFMLEGHRPMLRLMGHGLNIFEPVAAGFIGLERVESLRRILFDPDAVDRVVENLKKGDDADGASSGK